MARIQNRSSQLCWSECESKPLLESFQVHKMAKIAWGIKILQFL